MNGCSFPRMQEIDERAEIVASNLIEVMRLSVPIDLHRAIRLLGTIEYAEAPLSDSDSGWLVPLPEFPGHYLLVVNSLHAPTRQRFTIAHELGHYLLHHREKIQPRRQQGFFQSQIHELEANAFAAALLMPKPEVIRAVRRGWPIGRMTQHFMVSRRALEIRIERLGLGSSIASAVVGGMHHTKVD